MLYYGQPDAVRRSGIAPDGAALLIAGPAAVPARRRAAPRRASDAPLALRSQVLALLTIALLGAGAVTPLAGLVRWIFPVGSALLAVYLAVRGRTAAYLSLCLWLFLLTPCLRRVIDLHAGYSQGGVMMLAPYLATAAALLRLPGYFLSPRAPLQLPIVMILICLTYGFILAVAGGRMLPGAIDLLRWASPPLLAVYLMADPAGWDELCAAVKATSLVALPAIGLYGLWQFVSPPMWDVYWMLNTTMSSIGFPRPFEIRVFATLNSPGSLSFWLTGLMLYTLTLKTPLRWFNLAVGAGALAVTLIRSAWVGLALGLALLAARAGPAVRLGIVGALVATVTLAPLALANPRTEAIVSKRLDTLFNLGGDVSYTARASAYAAFREELVDRPWGEGLGIANVGGAYGGSARIIDGGPIEILLSLGLVFGALYAGAIALVLGAVLMRPAPPRQRDLFSAAGAIVTVQALELSSVMTVGGEIGVVFWVAAALVAAAPRKTISRNGVVQTSSTEESVQMAPRIYESSLDST